MQYITGHTNLDLDSFASMLAAQKLYPDAKLVVLGQTQEKVRELISLHKDIINIVRVQDVQFDLTTRLIIVDTNSPDRIGKLKPLLTKPSVEVIVYDHHPLTEHSIRATKTLIEPVGATTTLLVEQIKQQGLDFSSFEATLVALGIYADTNCLTLPSTTYRDAEALAFLLAQGANINFIAEHIGKGLSEEQWDLLHSLIQSLQQFEIRGKKIYISCTESETYVTGLSNIAESICELRDLPVIFIVVKMKDKIYVVGRSNDDSVFVNEPLHLLGGGGHPGAASAIVKNLTYNDIINTILSTLAEGNHSLQVAKNLMTSPVKTVASDLSLDEIYGILLRYGHTGVPVIENNTLVGIISKRDIEKALRHNLGHAPAKAYMSRNIIFVSVDTPLRDIRQLMINHDIGRVPVMDGKQLVGIITRTDLLTWIHGKSIPQTNVELFPKGVQVQSNLKDVMNHKMHPKIFQLVELIGQMGDNIGVEVFLVGGIVRDLLIGKDNSDIDLVVEGDGIKFANQLVENLGGQLKAVHNKFGTATIVFDDGLKLDVATTRAEFYEYPAALPTVEYTTLKQDLYRRDFTINTLAIKLNKHKFGYLVDFFGGYRDVNNKTLRVLHNFSFVDDPTRIFRAVRFEQRYGFFIDDQTYNLIQLALQEGHINNLSKDRIAAEINHILREDQPECIMERLNQLGIIEKIHDRLIWNAFLTDLFRDIRNSYCTLKPILKISKEILLEQAYILGWLYNHEDQRVEEIIEKLCLKGIQTKHVQSFKHKLTVVQDKMIKNLPPSEINSILGSFTDLEYILLYAVTKKNEVAEMLNLYHNKLTNIQPELKGEDLLALGFKQNALLGKCLNTLKNKRLDGQLSSKEEEIIFAQKFLTQYKGGE